ncbi:MAG: CPBP family intramembrane metalloprotease [Syntrophomonadaceae bacterium]|jgi:membrane protease YdiL (CAAX protease family)|nr:CPBP family intramembrane metalloprotease [Syntrophomonadaceae bacterium]
MWGEINKFVRSQAVLAVFLLSILFISVVTVLGILILDLTPSVRLAIFTVGQLMLSGTAVWLMRKLEVFGTNDFKFKGIGKGFCLAWFGFLYIAITFLICFMSIPENSFIAPSMFYLLIVVLHPFIGTGLFEEVLYRGLVLKILLKKTGGSKRGIILACVISSAIFGLLHIVNILAGDTVLPTVTLIISATATGLFFAAVFMRTGKLWISIFLHGLLNVSSQIFNAIVSPDALTQNTEAQARTDIVGFIINTLFQTLPILIAAVILLRKVKPDEISDKKIIVSS